MSYRERELPNPETPHQDTLRAHAHRIVRETRLSQGLSETITDPVVLARLATLIQAVTTHEGPRHGREPAAQAVPGD